MNRSFDLSSQESCREAEVTHRRDAAIHIVVPPILFYLGVKLSLLFAVTEDSIVMLWMPNGVLLATLIHYGFKRYGLFVIGVLAAELAADIPTFPVIEALAFGVINISEATVAYLLLRRLRFDPAFPDPVDLAKFVFAGPLLAAFAAAFAAGGIYVTFGGHVATYWNFVRVWWFSDGLGLLLITPLVLSLWPAASRGTYPSRGLLWYDIVAIGACLVLASIFALADQGEFRGFVVRALLLLPFALYVAARFDMRATSAVVVAISILVVNATYLGRNPFGDLPLQTTIIATQEYILTMALMSLGLNAFLTQQSRYRAELTERVRERTSELNEANRKLEQLALTDALTGLPNRRALLAQLAAELSRHQRQHRPLALIMFDIDHFKRVNDRYGHAAGDAALLHVAANAAKVIREMDTLGRYGGEEFLLIAPEADEHDAVALAERVRDAIRSGDVLFDHHTIRVSASFGVAALHTRDATPEVMLRRVDAALYDAKEAGRDRVVLDRDETGARPVSTG